jgi:DNA-binding LytR/AlgR family response regulator
MTTALIADDEPLLREQLTLRLAKGWPELHVIAEAANGALAVSEYAALKPDIVFLDIHMPLMNGLDAAKAISALAKSTHHHVEIVFVTAYDQYAIEAFQRGAIDYVLKPYDIERLAETIERLKSRTQQGVSNIAPAESNAALAEAIRQINEKLQPSSAYLQWIKASVGQTVRLIPIDDVLYFRSDEKYTCVVLEDSEVLIRKSIKELLTELDPNRFWQIHRATIINTRAVAGVVRGSRDQADLKVKGRDEILTVSRNFTHLFKQM